MSTVTDATAVGKTTYQGVQGVKPEDVDVELGLAGVKSTVSSEDVTKGVEQISLKADAKELPFADVPFIDIDAIENATGAERAALLQAYGDGLKSVGFVAIKADSLTPILEEVYAEMKGYFAQDLEAKMRDAGESGQAGYAPPGLETAAGFKAADIKETYFVNPDDAGNPTGRPEFNRIMTAYHKELTQYAAKAMSLLVEYLGEPTGETLASVGSAGNKLRLAHYPARKPADDPEAVWAADHKDLNGLTLLPPSTVPGLQLLTKDGEWKVVNVPPGYLIVNTGEQVEKKTAGYIQATRHQVVNPGGEFAYQERFSTPFFASWANDYSLAPFPSCVEKMTAGMTESEKKSYLRDYPDVTVLENLFSRLIEMGVMKPRSNTPEDMKAFVDLARDLRQKGLLMHPPEELTNLVIGLN